MALGILGAYGGLIKKELPEYVMVGELSLDGGIRGVRGALPIAIAARAKKIANLIVPEVNAREAAVVSGVNVYPVKSLIDVVNLLNTGNGVSPLKVDTSQMLAETEQSGAADFKEVRGQFTAKRALEIARAGGQHSDDRTTGARAKPCWPSAYRVFCRRSRLKKRWRPPRFTALPVCWMPQIRW